MAQCRASSESRFNYFTCFFIIFIIGTRVIEITIYNATVRGMSYCPPKGMLVERAQE